VFVPAVSTQAKLVSGLGSPGSALAESGLRTRCG
jgi:hypothetical protein